MNKPPLTISMAAYTALAMNRPLFVVAFPAMQLDLFNTVKTIPASQQHYLTEFNAYKALRDWNHGTDELPAAPEYAKAEAFHYSSHEVRAAMQSQAAAIQGGKHA